MKDMVIKTVMISADPFVLGRHFKSSEQYKWVERIIFKTIQNGDKCFIYKILDRDVANERYFGDVLSPDGTTLVGSFNLEKEAIDFLSKRDMSISIE